MKSLLDITPYEIQHELKLLTSEQKIEFENRYSEKYINPKHALLGSLVGVQYLVMHKPLILLLFWISMFLSVGITWWTYDIITIYHRVKKQNNKFAYEILDELKMNYQL